MEFVEPVHNSFLDTNRDINMICNNNTGIHNAFRQSQNVVEFGSVTGIVVALLVNLLFIYKYKNFNKKHSMWISDLVSADKLSIIIILSVISISLPILIFLSIIASVYKSICTLLIKRKAKGYVGLLDSFDVFWSLEEATSKSIINVVGTIETESSTFVVSCIREKLKTIYAENKMEKIFYRRIEEYGLYYWLRNNNVDLDEYIKIIDLKDGKINSDSYLEELMAEYSEKPLPCNDEGLFQILVTGSPVKLDSSNKRVYGIIFKIHHSLGDGIALIELLCQNLADDNSEELFKGKNVLCKSRQNAPNYFINQVITLIQMAVCFAKGVIRHPDENVLHGPALNGNKIFTWTHSDDNLLPMMKDVKRKVGVRMIDILTAALSEGLKNYFVKSQRKQSLPEEVAVVLPIRFPRSNDNGTLKLENNFSVTILDVPIKRKTKSNTNLDEIRKRYDDLRTSADPITNYYFLKFAGAVLPSHILKPLLTSRQATLVLSNIPGPETLSICGGNTLKQLVFFVPNKGYTGVGVTAMSYGGVLRLAAAADRALVSDPEDLALILDGMVEEIRRLHRLYCSH